MALLELRDRVAIDSHVRVVGIGQQTDDAGFFRDEAVAQFVFVVFGMDLPGRHTRSMPLAILGISASAKRKPQLRSS